MLSSMGNSASQRAEAMFADLGHFSMKSIQPDIEVPTFTAAIDTHQKQITHAILEHAFQLCTSKNVTLLLEQEKLEEIIKLKFNQIIGEGDKSSSGVSSGSFSDVNGRSFGDSYSSDDH
ncbi:hypothetical protein P3S67_015538 [Capsicum chacoense]